MRWVLLQVLPALLKAGDDTFVTILNSLHGAKREIMWTFARTTLLHGKTCFLMWKKLTMQHLSLYRWGPGGRWAKGVLLLWKRCWSSPCSLWVVYLCKLYMFYKELHLFSGIIIVGTGLSMVIVKDAVRSASAKFREKKRVTIFTETGLFLNIAFRTGNPRVGFSHTVPALPNTVPMAGTTRTWPVNRAVSHGILDTCGYVLLKYCKYMYIKYEKN